MVWYSTVQYLYGRYWYTTAMVYVLLLVEENLLVFYFQEVVVGTSNNVIGHFLPLYHVNNPLCYVR